MCDTRYCKGLPEGMRASAATILGKHCVNQAGERYADIQRPSYSYDPGPSTYASHIAKRRNGTITA